MRKLILPLLVLVACKAESDGPKPVADKPMVVASIFPVYDLVRRVGGEHVEVILLLQPGQSAHNYAPSAKDAKRVAKAKAAFMVGLALDEWAAKVVEASGGGATVVELGEIVGAEDIDLPRFEDAEEKEEEHHEEEHHHHEGLDPHIWLSVPKAKAMVAEIEKALTAAVPGKDFGTSATKLSGELDALHEEVKTAVEALENRSIITFHGSFGYFAKEYGVEIAAVVEPSPGKEPSAAYLKQILEAVKDKKLVAVYTEPQLDARPAEVLAKEAKLPVRLLDPIGGVEGRDSYEKLIRYNVAALK